MKWYRTVFACILLISSFVLAEEGQEETESQEPEKKSEEKTELPRLGHVDLENQRQMALVSELRADEIVWLDVEYPVPEGAQGQASEKRRVLALKRPSQKPHKHGAVLLVPGRGQHADWPDVVRPLRKELPESGWFTLSLTLPNTAVAQVPERQLPLKKFDEVLLSESLKDTLNGKSSVNTPETEGDAEGDEQKAGTDAEENQEAVSEGDNAEDADSETAAEQAQSEEESVDIDLEERKNTTKPLPYTDKALVHVNEGMKYLRQEGYQNIALLAYRSSVNIALEYIKQNQGMFSDKGFALVVVDPKFSAENQLDLSGALGQNFQAPILELVNADETESLAKERLASTKIAGAVRYMQTGYAFSRAEESPKRLVRRVRYWLEKNAPGMLVKSRAQR